MFDSVHVARLPERLDGVRRPQQFICERRESGGENMSISELVLSLEAIDPSLLDRDGVNAALCSVARIHSWLEVKQAHLVRRLKALAEASACVVPEADIAAATRTSRGDAERMSKRADALGALPEIESALSTGQLSASHVDALARTMRDLTPEQRTLFAAQGAQHATIAQRSTPEQFARYLRREAQRFSKRAGEDRLTQQRKNSGVRWWLDSDTGMWVLRAELDPETGLIMQGRLENAVDTLFRSGIPDTCPSGHGQQAHLRGLAFVQLTSHGPHCDNGSGLGERRIDQPDRRFEVSIVIDLETLRHGLHEHSLIDNGNGADLPVESYRRMACSAALIPVVLNSAGVVLDQGREIRLANRAQRRALRAMYATCALPDCTVRSKYCEPHHIVWWQHNGATDLDNLLPLCSRHHHSVHEGGWQLAMGPDRSLTITYPNGEQRITGPPSMARAQ